MSDRLFEILRRQVGRTLAFETGQRLFHQGDTVRSVFVLVSGAVELVRFRSDGSTLVLHRWGGRGIVAEASVYADRYHCDCVCVAPAEVLVMPRGRVRQLLHVEPAAALWAAHLAQELQATRFRCELLTRKTVAERVAGWCELHGDLPPKGRWHRIAAEIGVTPEALYREIARRRG